MRMYFTSILATSLLACAGESVVADGPGENVAIKAALLDALGAGQFESVNGLAISPDYSRVYSTRWVEGEDGRRARLVVQERNGDDFQSAEPLFPAHSYSDYQPVLGGEDLLFFTSTRPIDGSGEAARQNVWFAVRQADGSWGDERPIRDLVSPAWDGHAVVTSPGEIIFASDRPGGKGGVDIYSARFDDLSIKGPTNVGVLNSPDSDSDMSFHASSGTLVFSRYSEADDDIDIFASTLNDGKWTAPVALDAVNTEHWELSPVITPDGCQLLFKRRYVPGFLQTNSKDAGLGSICDEDYLKP